MGGDKRSRMVPGNTRVRCPNRRLAIIKQRVCFVFNWADNVILFDIMKDYSIPLLYRDGEF